MGGGVGSFDISFAVLLGACDVVFEAVAYVSECFHDVFDAIDQACAVFYELVAACI